MCDNCDKAKEDAAKTEDLYKKYLDQEKIDKGNMTGGMYETGLVHLPDVGLMFLQQSTERQLIGEDGVTELPDSKVQAIFIHEDAVESLMRDIVHAMGPLFMINMLRNSVERMNDDDQ